MHRHDLLTDRKEPDMSLMHDAYGHDEDDDLFTTVGAVSYDPDTDTIAPMTPTSFVEGLRGTNTNIDWSN